MAVTTTNLGVITAYGDAVAAGYTGTKAEWQALMASYATVGQQAVDAKNDAVAAKDTAVSKATEATTAASTATTKASEASASAQSIAQSAAQIQENTDDIDQLKSEFTVLDDVVLGVSQLDASKILSNNNNAVTNNGDGTYNIGTNDYGTTVFDKQITLAPGKYMLNGTKNGRMVIATTTNASDAVYQSYANPLVFELTESLSCYLIFRMDQRPSSAFVLTPYIKTVGAAYDAKHITGVITSAMSDAEDITDLYVEDVTINTSAADGTIIDITPSYNTGFASAIVPCKTGDIFIVSGRGGQGSLLWAFTDKTCTKLCGSGAYATGNESIVTAENDGFFISNIIKAVDYSLYVRRFSERSSAVQIVNPHDLKWVMGQFGNTGVVNGTFTDRMYTICKVKAGSVILAPSANGVNVKVGYYLGEPTGTMDYYATFNYGAFKITQDCTLYLGVIYNTPAYLLNDSLLDSIRISLIVDDFEIKYAKKKLGNYGNPPSPSIYYEGQHADTTGWTNESVDVNAIHAAYDALVTASNGYLTKKDLGEVWNGYHYYEYSTNPVGLHSGGLGLKVPKVLITCEMHGNEKMSTYAMHYMLYDLIHNPHKNPILSYLRANVQLVVIPITNPWGYINTSRWNENGVNLNRNFPTHDWADYDEGADSAPGGINYKGTSAGSEPETKAMINFIRSHPDAVLCIDLHTNGVNTSAWYEVTSTMLACTGDTSDPAYSMQREYLDASHIQINFVKPWCDGEYGSDLGNVYYGNVKIWNDEPYISEWVTEATNTLGITYEVPAGSSNGYLGNKLTKYAPDTIKCSAELFGNYILSMLCVAKDN